MARFRSFTEAAAERPHVAALVGHACLEATAWGGRIMWEGKQGPCRLPSAGLPLGGDERRLHQDEVVRVEHDAVGSLTHGDLKLV